MLAVLEDLASVEKNDERKAELLKMASVCRKVPANAPDTVHEMLQHYWFIHLGVITELNPWDSFNPGRLDQHLFVFIRKRRRQEHFRMKSFLTSLAASG